MRFADRRDAGKRLARELKAYAGMKEALVFGLPRGGLVVAGEVARILSLPLDALCVRKIGAPFQPELAIGAVAPGGVQLVNRELAEGLGISPAAIRALAEGESKELERRDRLYRAGRPFPDVRGKTAIVVDDGIATGFTMHAALAFLKRKGPARVIAAAPVCAARACEGLRDVCDRTVCLLAPEEFYAIGEWYRSFDQTEDEEVVSILDRSRAMPAI